MNKTKYDIKDLQKVAKANRGSCLSKTYKGTTAKYEWECSKGHLWKQSFHQVKGSTKRKGTWCPICSKNAKKSIKDARELASIKKGKCLSKSYVNARTKMLWQCQKGHKWKATYEKVKTGKWCPHCAGNARGSIEQMNEIASELNGKCLSKKYVNTHTKMNWQCDQGHKFKMTPADVKSGKWCGKCGRKRAVDKQKLGLDPFIKIAKERGGKLLTKKYTSTSQKLRFECGSGHKWSTTAGSIKYGGSWCPVCQRGLKERICRTYFEKIFKAKFPESWDIKWLLSSTGNRMSLDGYNKKLGIAFEHQGEHHYTTKTHFIKDNETLQKRIKDDKLKISLCKKHDVKLIVIPSLFTRIDLDDLLDFLKAEFKKKKIKIPSNIDKIKISLADAYSPQKKKEVKKLIEESGGELISNKFDGNEQKLSIRCKEGHKFKMSFGILKRGSWCPECAKVKKGASQRLSIAVCKEEAKKRNGKCLSKTYINSHSKIKWKCQEGHTWESTLSSVRAGKWCRRCAAKKNNEKRKLTINNLKDLAKQKQGKLISKAYLGYSVKHEWRCNKGHTFWKSPTKVKTGKHFCPYCSGTDHLIKKKSN